MDQRRRDPGFDERRWRRLEPAIENSGQVSLHGIPGPVVVQVLYGLQQRTREGSKTGVSTLRQVGWELRLMQPESVEHVAVQARREHQKLVSCFARHVRRAFLWQETERVKDVWDLVAFGLSGRLDFIKISQPWLREAAKRWAADDLPRRRGKATAGPVQHYLVSLAALSEGLRAARPDRGDAPNALGRDDIEAFLHRLAFLVADETPFVYPPLWAIGGWPSSPRDCLPSFVGVNVVRPRRRTADAGRALAGAPH